MSRVQRLESSVQSPASRVQRPESNVQGPESSVQSPEPRVQLLRLESRNSGMPKETTRNPSNVATAKIYFPRVYVIGTTCFDGCFHSMEGLQLY